MAGPRGDVGTETAPEAVGGDGRGGSRNPPFAQALRGSRGNRGRSPIFASPAARGTGCLRSRDVGVLERLDLRARRRAVDERLTVDHDSAGFRLTFATGDNTGKIVGGDR